MWKVAKYKIYNIFENKRFLILMLIYIILFNYRILTCGVFTPEEYIPYAHFTYALLINNFHDILMGIGLVLTIYLGCNIVSDDVKTGRINIMLPSFPDRWKYLVGNYLGMIVILACIMLISIINYLILAVAIKIDISYSDLIIHTIKIFMNMITVLLVSSFITLLSNKKVGLLVAFLDLVIYNIYDIAIIPVINKSVNVTTGTRRILATIFPMTDIYPASIMAYEDVSYSIITPLLFGDMLLYQIFFIIVLTLVSVKVFKHKEF